MTEEQKEKAKEYASWYTGLTLEIYQQMKDGSDWAVHERPFEALKMAQDIAQLGIWSATPSEVVESSVCASKFKPNEAIEMPPKESEYNSFVDSFAKPDEHGLPTSLTTSEIAKVACEAAIRVGGCSSEVGKKIGMEIAYIIGRIEALRMFPHKIS